MKDGVVSGGGKSVTYGQLVAGQQLTLTIPVERRSDEPVRPHCYGQSADEADQPVHGDRQVVSELRHRGKVTAKEKWVTDVRLPGMLHGRVVHPKTLGSTLDLGGRARQEAVPERAGRSCKGNLVGVVAPTEWEAIGAAQQVATAHEVDGVERAARPHQSAHVAAREGRLENGAGRPRAEDTEGDVATALAGAAKKLSRPTSSRILKHAPIGPTMAVGRRQGGRHRVRPHPQPESAGASRAARA